MATVNRYTQTQENIYQPRTLQELMVAPAYKRQKHDELDAGIAQYETQLAQSDATSEHMGVLKERQDKLYQQMLSQRDKLETEGFTQSSKSNFIKFNKDYQQEMGPQGTIGKISKANEVMQANEKLYLGNAIKDGYSPAQAKINWDAHRQQYAEEFNQTGKVSSIDELYAPKYMDHIEEGRKYFKDAGITETDFTTGNGQIKTDKDGTYVINTKTVRGDASNISQLKAAVDFLNNRLLNKGSDLNKSIKHQGLSEEAAIKDIIGMSGIYTKKGTKTEDSSTISNFSATATDDEKKFDGSGLTAVSARYDMPESERGYVKVNDTINDLKSKGTNLTKEEKATLSKYESYQIDMDNRLANIPDAKIIQDNLNKALADFKSYKAGTYKLTDSEKVTAGATVNSMGEELGPNYANSKIGEQLVNRINQYETELKPYTDKVGTDIRLVTNNYAFSPMTTKQESTYNIFQRSMANIFTADAGAMAQNTNILRITDEDGNQFSELTPRDLDGISKLVYNADPKDIQITTFTPRGENGLPGYSLKIKAKDSYNLDGINPFKRPDDTVGGDGEYINVDITFDKNQDSKAIRNINGLAQQYLASTGKEGRDLVGEMQMNDTRNDYKGYSWKELTTSGKVQQDSSLSNLFYQEIDNRLYFQGIEDPTEEEYNDAKTYVMARNL